MDEDGWLYFVPFTNSVFRPITICFRDWKEANTTFLTSVVFRRCVSGMSVAGLLILDCGTVSRS